MMLLLGILLGAVLTTAGPPLIRAAVRQRPVQWPPPGRYRRNDA